MSVIGFVNQDQIQRQYLLGDGCMIFQPVENDDVRKITDNGLKSYILTDFILACRRRPLGPGLRNV